MLSLAILLAMVLIPAFSLKVYDVAPRPSAQGEPSIRGDTVRELKEGLKRYLSTEDIEYLEARYLLGKGEGRIVRGMDKYAYELAQDNFLNVPMEFSRFVKSRIGSDAAKRLRARMRELRPTASSIKELGPEELYHRRDALPADFEYVDDPGSGRR